MLTATIMLSLFIEFMVKNIMLIYSTLVSFALMLRARFIERHEGKSMDRENEIYEQCRLMEDIEAKLQNIESELRKRIYYSCPTKVLYCVCFSASSPSAFFFLLLFCARRNLL